MHFYKLPLLLVLLGWAGGSCNFVRQYEAHQQARQREADSLGIKRNPQREQLGIPLLPDSGWGRLNSGVEAGGAFCAFSNKTPGLDSLPRHAEKKIVFSRPTLQPVQEVETYYSGRKFIEGDPDYYGWERVELIHAYQNDTLTLWHGDRLILRQGRKYAVLNAAQRTFYTSNIRPESEYLNTLEPKVISVAQADSVLKAWGLSRWKD